MSAPTNNQEQRERELVRDQARSDHELETVALDHARVAAETTRWVREFVVGLNLCPFAQGPLDAGRVRVVVSAVDDAEALAGVLTRELDHLVATPPGELETTLLVHPLCLAVFVDHNDFLDVVDAVLVARGLVGEIQVASFHPDYRFTDAPADDPANATNRSPYPMLHLLREASVSRAVASHPDVGSIPARNIELLRSLRPEV